MKKREAAIKEKMEDAKAKVKTGDNQTAIQELRAVYDQKCLFPKRAKDAAKELKKLGVTNLPDAPDSVNLDRAVMARGQNTISHRLNTSTPAKYMAAKRIHSHSPQTP